MHQESADKLSVKEAAKKVTPPSTSECPMRSKETTQAESKSIISQLNPLNYMFPDLSQKRAPNQTHALPTSREESTIPKGTGVAAGRTSR